MSFSLNTCNRRSYVRTHVLCVHYCGVLFEEAGALCTPCDSEGIMAGMSVTTTIHRYCLFTSGSVFLVTSVI